MGRAGLVVDDDARRHLEDLDAFRDEGALNLRFFPVHLARQRTLDLHCQLGQGTRSGQGRVRIVLKPERVQRHALRRGEHLGIDDVGIRCRDGAGDPREQTRMVLGVDRQFGHIDVVVHAGAHAQRQLVLLGLAHHARLVRQRVGVEGQPVTRIAALEMRLDIGVRPFRQRPAQPLLGDLDPLGPGIRQLAARHHVAGRVIQLTQQLGLPAVPHIRAGGAHIDHG